MDEAKIKRGLNVYLYYWTIPIFFALILINYFTRTITLEALDMNLMISIVSFLFGFLITITFSMLMLKTSSLKEALAIEAGRLVSLFLLSKQLGKNFHEKIKEKIDDYTISTLREYTTYEVGRESVYGMYEDINFAEIKTKHQETSMNSFLYILGEFEPLREKLEYLTNRRVEWPIKAANYILGILLILLLFLNRGDTFTNMLFVILTTTIIFVFLIIEDYDNLKIGDYTYNISNSEQIFDLIERERYYPQEILSRVNLISGKTYRIGIIDSKTKQEKIFTIQYTPQFSSKINFLVKKSGKKD